MLKFLQEFLECVFLGVALKLLLEIASVWSGHTMDKTRLPAKSSRTLDLTVGSCSNFYRSFKRFLSLESHYNC
jgi:hypothetical protein